MAECEIKEDNLEFTGVDENDAMAELYTNYMAKHLKDVPENGDVFMGNGFWKWFRFDRAGVTDMSKNKLVRGISNILYESIGKTGKNWVRSRTMSQVKNFELNRQRTLYYKNWVSNYDAWLKENGYKRIHLDGITKREEFNELVARAIRGEAIESPTVQKMANAQRERYRDLLQKAKDSGVRGADKIEENFNYLTRIYSNAKLSKLIDKFGEEKVINFLAKAMRGGLSEKANKRLAKYLTRVIQRQRSEYQMNIGGILNAKAEDLNRILREQTDLSADEILEITGAIFPSKSGTSNIFKSRRVKLDETYSDGEMSIADFLENDSEILFLNYANNLTGQMALAERGFRSGSDWTKMMRQIEKEYEAQGIAVTDKTRINEMKALQSGYDHLVGKPLEDISTTYSTFGRIMRKYNFARIMNQVGFAQLAEIGVLIANTGLRQTIKHLPEMRKLIKRLKNGEIDDEFMREAEEIFGGFGSERLINQVANQSDEFGARISKSKIRKVERTLDHLNRITADISGMNIVNMAMKRIALKGMVQKWVDQAFGGKAAMSLKRARDLGISDAMYKRILDQIKKHAITEEGALTKRKIKRINIDNWADQEAASTYAHAINRWGRRTIQENDIGEQMFLGGLTDTTTGKILFQFRGFMMTAYGKHLLHGLKMNDVQAYKGFVMSTMFAGMAYVAQIQAQAVLMTGRDRKKFLENRLGKTEDEIIKNIAKAGFQRSAFASLIPAFVDTGLGIFGVNPLFHYRSTGLDSNIITGNPTYDLLWTKGFSPTGGIARTAKSMWDSDYDFSQSQYNDLTQMFILQNALGIQNVIRKLGSMNLPEKP
tara:strand:- start:135 stop:2618 length:2484 start_codon:yes stop_codon:yes gene_type:complete